MIYWKFDVSLLNFLPEVLAMRYFSILLLGGIYFVPATILSADDPLDFNLDIRPILSKNCFACHGPDPEHRESGLHLGERAIATSELDSGSVAIVPGQPEQSELVARITSTDEFTVMPPKDSGHELKPDEIEKLTRWVKEGASYARHWSFVKPRRPELPDINRTDWIRNEIDHFVLARLEARGLTPNPEADRHALIRRLSFDLRGLPPQPEEVARFVNDNSTDAYEQLVDRFLADPAYGERWARVWLDLARYADSRGYGSDPLRENIWRYRDWVIDAFNRNQPYDEFSRDQLAGDLLPDPTLDQKVATAFHRNTMTNTEGGTDDEEFRVAAVKDRVDTTMQVWMGLTMGCAQCHTHKYDPITQREYYRFYDLFNQTADRDLPSEAPVINAPTPEWERQVAAIDQQIDELKQSLSQETPEIVAARNAWEAKVREQLSSEVKPLQARFVRVELPGNPKMLSLAEVQVFSSGKNIATSGKATQSSTDYNGPPELAIDGNTDGHYANAMSTTHTRNEANPWWEVDLGGDQPIERLNLWNRTDNNLHTRLANFRVLLQRETDDKQGKPARETVWSREIKESPNPNVELTIDPRMAVPDEIAAIVQVAFAERTAEQTAKLNDYYQSIDPGLKKLRDQIVKLEKSKPAVPTVPVMQELPPEQRRATHIHERGNFLSLGDKVTAGLPESFFDVAALPPRNRLDVVAYLFHEDNPLTARVAVNRFWAKIFGLGLVSTEEDFGMQGELPSHPELLDWLAVEFQSDWDIKRLLKIIVTSASYRQSAVVGNEKLLRDPRNTSLSRGPRFRLEAEMVRDQALALSGLLSRKMHGPSVYPPQPPGLWRAAFNGQRTWPESKGEDKFRRGLYTFWRRTTPYPSMATFDAPSREICNIRRIRTNTPLQAFVTLNDPVYVEAAQALARRIMNEGGVATDERIRFGLTLCLVQEPSSAQIETIQNLYQSNLEYFQNNTTEATELATDPLGPLPEGVPPAEAASWTVVANVLLNLDSVLSK
jgi:hypothetical protein